MKGGKKTQDTSTRIKALYTKQNYQKQDTPV
jgi:hypothetical protein